MTELEEARAKIVQLEERLRKYDDERATYSLFALEHGTALLESEFFIAITKGVIEKVDTKEGTARSRATRQGNECGKTPMVLRFRVAPITLTEKVGNKWPRKKKKKV